LASKYLPSPFPYGTFFINLLGAFAIGIIYVLGVERSAISADLRTGIMVGFLGGFTTFSSYCLEGVRLAEETALMNAALYMVASPFLGFIATLSGMLLTRKVLGGFL